MQTHKRMIYLFLLLAISNNIFADEQQKAQANLQSFYEALEKKKHENGDEAKKDVGELEKEIARMAKETQKNNNALTFGRSLPETKEKQGEIEKTKLLTSKRLYNKEETIFSGQFDVIEIGNSVFANVDKRVLEQKINILQGADAKRTEIDINAKALDSAIRADGAQSVALLDSMGASMKFNTNHTTTQNDNTFLNDTTNQSNRTYVRIRKGQSLAEHIYVKDINEYEIKLAVN